MDAIRSSLGANCEVAGRSSHVKTILDNHVAAGHKFEVLNLIGHSNEDHFLIIGDDSARGWVLDNDAVTTFNIHLAAPIRDLEILKLRFLGCSTATKSGAWTVIHNIVDRLAATHVNEGFGTRR